jgi:Domain of unknown function (DUF4326)
VTAQRIQRRRIRGWRMPPGAVYVGRPSKWGNPYRAIRGTVYGPAGGPRVDGELVAYSTHAPAHHAVTTAVADYRRDIDLRSRSELTTDLIRRELAARDLVCWCPLDQPCHADVLLEIANPGGDR